MYPKIKQLADEAIALQNKDRMDAVLREISGVCADAYAGALNDLMNTGTGITSTSVNGDGEIEVKHVVYDKGCLKTLDGDDIKSDDPRYDHELAARKAEKFSKSMQATAKKGRAK